MSDTETRAEAVAKIMQYVDDIMAEAEVDYPAGREAGPRVSYDSDAIEKFITAALAQPGPSAEVRVKATLEALRVEAADDHFHDAWQQGVRYAISEVLDALATDAEG